MASNPEAGTGWRCPEVGFEDMLSSAEAIFKDFREARFRGPIPDSEHKASLVSDLP
jgi:hypothetical protein